MKLRTEVFIAQSDKKIEPDSKIFSIGSCFASEMSELLSQGQLQTHSNPFGTLFNPFSISNAVQHLHDSHFYTEEDLIIYDDLFISLDHHSSFDQDYAHKTLAKINLKIEEGNRFLQSADFVIVTFGSSFIYEFLPNEKLVANCHKIPGKFFEKRMLSDEEIANSMKTIIMNFLDICPEGVRILLSVSPVRHTRDGMVENSLSKAKLLSAVHNAVASSDNCTYLPVYEIVMDDLRDYRFYKEDLIHPNSQAVNYIFELFGSSYFSDETMDFVEENFRIAQSLKHRPAVEKSVKHQQFLEKIQERIADQQTKVKHKIFQD